jgi:hypothetical protein
MNPLNPSFANIKRRPKRGRRGRVEVRSDLLPERPLPENPRLASIWSDEQYFLFFYVRKRGVLEVQRGSNKDLNPDGRFDLPRLRSRKASLKWSAMSETEEGFRGVQSDE